MARSVRWAARAGIALIGLAAAVGAARFGGLESLANVHGLLSDQSAIVAVPLLAMVLFIQHHEPPSPQHGHRRATVLCVFAALLMADVLLQQRSVAALLSIATLATLIGSRPRQSACPILLLAGLLLAGGVRAWTALPLDARLIGLHVVLAIWLLVYVRCLPCTQAAGPAASSAATSEISAA